MNLQKFKKQFYEVHPYRAPYFIMDKGLRRVYKQLYGCDPVEREMYLGIKIVFYKPRSKR